MPISQKNRFFPSDFFSTLPQNIKEIKNEKIKSKSIFINLQKEEEEDRELIELLQEKHQSE